MSAQAPASVVLIRPHHFSPNAQTNGDNAYQSWHRFPGSAKDIADGAYHATTQVARELERAGIRVHLFDDDVTGRPDSVFPNNWFSTHSGGRVALYPMYAQNRRTERRGDVIDFLKEQYRVREVIDYSGLEHDGVYLEGTGTMVLDHVNRVAYTARSLRANPVALERFCTHFGYEPMVFDAVDPYGVPIYHTNILMSIGTRVALVGLDAIVDADQRRAVQQRLVDSGRQVIALSHKQLMEFAGNAIELRGPNGRGVLAMSARAAGSLTIKQVKAINESCDLLPLEVGPIELAGGSVRCMIAGIHLESRPSAVMPATRSEPDAAKLSVA